MVSIINQGRTPTASVAIADGMDSLYNTVEQKRMMTNENANTIQKINSVIMITMRRPNFGSQNCNSNSLNHHSNHQQRYGNN